MCPSEPVRSSSRDHIPHADPIIVASARSRRSRRHRRPHRIAALDGAQPAARRALASHFAALRAALGCVYARAAARYVPRGARARLATLGARGGHVRVGEWAYVRDARRGGAARRGGRERCRNEHRSGGRRCAGRGLARSRAQLGHEYGRRGRAWDRREERAGGAGCRGTSLSVYVMLIEGRSSR